MRPRRLIWQLYPSYFFITVLSVIAVTWIASRALRGYHRERATADLRVRCLLLEHRVRTALADGAAETVDAACKDEGQRTGARFTVILPTGVVIGDSEANPAGMDNHALRPEIAAALAGGTDASWRFSDTLRENMLYVAEPLRDGSRVAAVVRAALPLADVERHFRGMLLRIVLGSGVVALVAAAVCLVVSRRISGPLVAMERGAARFAGGDLGTHLSPPPTVELARLADALNRMADQLAERLRTVVRERNQKEALFAGMGEGVLAVDRGEVLREINPAAARLFGIQADAARGRTLEETIRNADLQQFVIRALAGAAPAEGDIALYNGGVRFMQAHASPLRDEEGGPGGVLVVLNDVTRLKQLENVRRDFVANVSHELKTPITSIRGAVETLQERAGDLPEDVRPFVSMALRHTARLAALIDDLLSLARVEYDAERGAIRLDPLPVRPVLEGAIHACEARAAERVVSVELDCPPDLEATLNPPLLEQAVANLLANAIQYSEPATSVHVRGRRAGATVRLEVVDQGCGIAAPHLPRLFERFYRVDMARSRKLGGTGLGLAIVKHIVVAHGGTVAVQSEVGRGSTFTIDLPAPAPAGAA